MLDSFYPNSEIDASPHPQRLRAYIEIIDGELAIFPLANSDTDEKAILDALRFVIADGVSR
jgi:hypothetical protein